MCAVEKVGKEHLDRLIEEHEPPCVSIYMTAEKVNDQARVNITGFRNLVKQAEEKLRGTGLSDGEIQTLFTPAYKLLDDRLFWTQQDRGLAVFISKDYFTRLRTPAAFENKAHTGKRFFVQPLIPVVTDNMEFYMLSLTKKKISLYKCSRFEMNEMPLEGVPASLNDFLKYDVNEKQQQAHSHRKYAQKGKDSAVFHGQGGGKETEKTNIEEYFKLIDNAVNKKIGDSRHPLVIAGNAHLTGAYRKVNSYNALEQDDIKKNPDDMEESEFLDNAWQIVSGKIQKNKDESLDIFKQLAGTGWTAETPEDILEKAHEGRIEILFIPAESIDGRDVVYKLENEKLDAAALKTLGARGKVYMVEPGQLAPQNQAAAILRY